MAKIRYLKIGKVLDLVLCESQQNLSKTLVILHEEAHVNRGLNTPGLRIWDSCR